MSISAVSFHVPGTPVQQGNHRRNAAGATYETSKGHGPWRDSVIWHARQARPAAADDGVVFAGPVSVKCRFVFPYTKAHYRTGKFAHELRDDAPYWKTTAPDVDKLTRTILDALAIAGIYRDDAQVATLYCAKSYNLLSGVKVEVVAL